MAKFYNNSIFQALGLYRFIIAKFDYKPETGLQYFFQLSYHGPSKNQNWFDLSRWALLKAFSINYFFKFFEVMMILSMTSICLKFYEDKSFIASESNSF